MEVMLILLSATSTYVLCFPFSLTVSLSDSNMFCFLIAVPSIIIAHEFFDALPVHQFQVKIQLHIAIFLHSS